LVGFPWPGVPAQTRRTDRQNDVSDQQPKWQLLLQQDEPDIGIDCCHRLVIRPSQELDPKVENGGVVLDEQDFAASHRRSPDERREPSPKDG
jgi:hypothetical protein